MTRLSARQMDTLQWIADGCPERDWPDFSHRISAKSLANRGLVKVRGHGPTWTAEITQSGLALLSGDNHREPGRQQDQLPKRRASAGRQRQITGEDLLERLRESGGQLTVENPDPARRAEYRRALVAIPRDKVPAGLRVTFTGRDSGNLVISLTDVPAPPDPEPIVPIPGHPDPDTPLLRHLVEHPELLPVAPASRDRALRVLQAIFEECNRRGHLAQPSTESTLELVIMGEVLTARLSEESQKAHRPPDAEIADAKYDWQRIPARETREFNGRLVLTLEPQKWRPSSWADRQRWSLESRLPKFLNEAEEVARARAAEREKRQRERREKRLRWEQSRPLAVAAYLDQLNRERLDAQLNAYNQSRRLAEYATALEHAVDETTGADRTQLVAWIAWIREEAVRLDPVNHPDQLTYVTPDHLPVMDLSRFMPKGLDYSYPPDPGDD